MNNSIVVLFNTIFEVFKFLYLNLTNTFFIYFTQFKLKIFKVKNKVSENICQDQCWKVISKSYEKK